MKMEKYPEIENSYRTKFVEYLKNEGLTGGEWIVQEKVHGTNLQIFYDGFNAKVGSRNDWLEQSYNFFGNCWVSIVEDLKPSLNKIYDFFNDSFILYGELFGGVYEHPLVPRNDKSKKIQKGVDYSPDNHFYAFDLKRGDHFIATDLFENLCKEYQVFHAQTLFTGSFEECLNYPNKFLTRIPLQLGLPQIEGNTCEGVVIKPVVSKVLRSGQRVILKNKNEKFADKQAKPKKEKEPLILSDQAQKLLDIFSSFVTLARLDSALSKQAYTNKEFGKIINVVYEDILDDFMKDSRESFLCLDKKERDILTKQVRKEIVETIRTEFFKRV